MKLVGMMIVLLGVSTSAFGLSVPVPEIDGSSAVAAVALISGGMLVLRARRKK